MVVFVDLDGDDDELHNIQQSLSPHALSSQYLQQLRTRGGQSKYTSAEQHTSNHQNEVSPQTANRSNQNVNSFSAALSCYPVARSLSHQLDLNDLHSLSRTCRQFRANLLQYHHQLLSQSLRCKNDSQPLLAEVLHQNANSAMTEADINAVLEVLDFEFETVDVDRKVLSGKIGKCARDLVAECRKCGVVVCRNCAIKPPSNSLLRGRYRRLCARCKEAPLWMHTLPVRDSAGMRQLQPDNDERTASSSSSASSLQTSSSASWAAGSAVGWRQNLMDAELPSAFTASAYEHGACTCATRGVYLCQACGRSLRNADTTYKRVWTWRSRYSTHIGGLGTGMGEGDQGQKCGRGEDCLDAVESEVEIDCSERPAPLSPPDLKATDSDGAPKSEELPAGYLRQEVEGIGGVVKKKVKKRVRIGATVWEFDDERGSGKYLEREASGRERSWCAWCGRVVKGQKDRELHGDDCFMI